MRVIADRARRVVTQGPAVQNHNNASHDKGLSQPAYPVMSCQKISYS